MMELLDNQLPAQKKLEDSLWDHKYRGPLKYEDFVKKIKFYAKSITLKRGLDVDFIIDKDNSEIIKQLYLYFIGNKECKWNIHAGLIFAGKVGAGKTLLLLAYTHLANELLRLQITVCHSFDLNKALVNGTLNLQQRPLFIDEFGREPEEVKDYGNIRKPLIELLSSRYEMGARTYATTNYPLEKLGTKYGPHIISRIKEMCNYIILPGGSRRIDNTK